MERIDLSASQLAAAKDAGDAIRRVNEAQLQKTLDAAARLSSRDRQSVLSFVKVAAEHWSEMKKAIDVSMSKYVAKQREETLKALSSPVLRNSFGAREELAKTLMAVTRNSLPKESMLDELNRALASVRPPEMQTPLPPIEHLSPRDRVSDLEQRVAAEEAENRRLRLENQEFRRLLVQIDFRTKRIAKFFDSDPSASADEEEPEQPEQN